MLEVQIKKLDQAIKTLDLLGVKYKVITPDGAEYGELEVKARRNPETVRGLPRYNRMETRNFFSPLITGMKAGQVKIIECGEYDPRVISRDVSAYCVNTAGTGSVSCLTDRAANAVQVFALKNLG